MKTLWIIIVSLVGFSHSCFGANELPRDVRKFVDRRGMCDHIRGEVPEPGDEERIEEVNAGVRKHCAGTDMQLQALKRKYAKNENVMSRLAVFDPGIEAISTRKHDSRK